MSEEIKEGEKLIVPEILPLLPVRDVVIFPYMILPLFVGREASILAVDEAIAKDRLIFLAAQRDMSVDEPTQDDIYSTGTVASIMRMLKLPDGRVKVLIQGLSKARVVEYVQTKPTYFVKVQEIKEPVELKFGAESEALMRNIKETVEKMIGLGKNISNDVMMILDNVSDPSRMADLVASNVGMKVDDAQKILETLDPRERLGRVHELLQHELEILQIQARIQSQAKEEMSRSQREYFLREQMRAIKNELGDIDEKAEEIREIREKMEKAKMPPDIEKETLKQLNRLEMMHQDAAEASVLRTYLDLLVELPWSVQTKDNLDIKQAGAILDEDHYDLEKVKERILEYLSVRKLTTKNKGFILCFVGPPGVGKTSLGKSIARAMGRKFIRVSLGGIRDEAEIRGHRRTYVGALPGRVIQGIKQAGTNNPVFMLDEVDKIGADFRGDPSAALLEVLDPEQNVAFSDNYLNLPFDLSNVMFITTANIVDPIPGALKDRMEVLHLAGYTEQEKLSIAKKYLVRRQVTENGLKEGDIVFSDRAISHLITSYTREAGLRNLEREIASICRKVARRIAEDEKGPFRITPSLVSKYLGPPRFLPETELITDETGVATGLAWTEFGGDILHVEALVSRGKGNLTLTGHLGDVMKESARASVSYARARARELNIDPGVFDRSDIHIHVPAGAIPKDGPSAGVTMATALISALTKIPVRKDVAMTGEITLRGRILPIGGLKEKSLAALRANISKVIIPDQNEKDLYELPPYVRKKMEFIPVKDMDSLLAVVLKKPINSGRNHRGRKNKSR
jgi:ATP-dependent Lon protease